METRITVAELIERLSEFDAECEVRIANQPSWPFEYAVGSIESAWIEGNGWEGDGREVVYLAEAEQIGYLPGEAKESLGW